MKILYKPIGLVFGLVAGFVATRLSKLAWSVVDEQEPPTPTTEDASWPRVLGAAALQGMTVSVVGAAADRWGAKAFHYLTGAWPGEKRPDAK